jgi:hypothetical protein
MTMIPHFDREKPKFCKVCGELHETKLEMLQCMVNVADQCDCGQCIYCVAAWAWRAHPDYEILAAIENRISESNP